MTHLGTNVSENTLGFKGYLVCTYVNLTDTLQKQFMHIVNRRPLTWVAQRPIKSCKILL